MSKRRGLDEPNMSDTGLLVTVEDLINQAMGPPSVNMINFKVMQAVLHILARQQRLLEQRVEIKIAEVSPPRHKLKKHSEVIEDSSESSSSPSPKRSGFKEEREPRKRERGQREMERAEKLAQRAREKEERAASREKDKAQRATSKEREKAEKAALKEREREEKASSKERERAAKAQLKAERAASKEKDKEERAASKEREKAEKAMSKAERAASKEREKEVRTASKERERAEKAQLKAERAASKEREKEVRTASKERERAEKAQSKAERAASKEREKEERTASKEREKAEKEQSKAERAAAKEREKEERTASKERERAEKAQSKAERAASKEREKEERTASKEREKAEKEQSKAERAASKEREKEERAASKEREKEERTASKEREKAIKEQSKAERAASKEREKEEKLALKEKEKADKEQDKAEREQKKAEKLSRKEQEKAERAAQKEKKRMDNEENKSAKKGRKSSDSGISIKEVKRGKDSVLVVEKGPTTWSDAQGRGSIEVVTQSQFALLEAAVRDLRDMAAPQPLAMPDNEKLRSALAKGQATLPDTMQAMQIDARVKAAEGAIARMTGLLTQLAAAGELPEDLGQQMEEIQMERAAADMRAEDLKARPSLARKSVIIAPSAKVSEGSTRGAMLPRPSTAPAPRPSVSIMKQPSSRISTTTIDQGVSRDEMDDAVNRLREDLIKAMNLMTSRAGATADNALHTAKSAADKVDVATTLDARISTLHSLAVDYADQLNGFDAGLSTQMQSFREQMVQMRGDLQGGLTLLETVNNNAETAAVVELTSRYQELVTELESTLHSHRALTKLQTQLADELRSLVECVELLRDQKADKDEVADGLRDKADTSRLAGLLTETEFALARADLERRLAVCHDKFQRQDNVWMTAVKDLNKILDGKSEILDLLSCRDEVQKQLQLLHDRLQVLAAVLGEPKAAAVKRQLAAGAACAACGTAALMSPRDATRGAPPRLPALRPPPADAPSKEPCLKDWMPPDLPDDRHVCRRWCGGSHTMVTESTRREQATAVVTEGAPTKRYTGFGADGRLYMMEEELQPCVECNQIAEEKTEVPPLDIGAGDQNPQQEMVVNIHLTEWNK
ncbi:zinc finger CCCH domain-containing protein 13-like [Pieris napi]|uniref:zinc finger CCCH domain-containing protein 13-like n=1 Tax=Pieris napi TaxID=78633 RepID=UPI001FBB038C|nr:zinc finger CCCH domain-containing protein 13-like [Pieris napi]